MIRRNVTHRSMIAVMGLELAIGLGGCVVEVREPAGQEQVAPDNEEVEAAPEPEDDDAQYEDTQGGVLVVGDDPPPLRVEVIVGCPGAEADYLYCDGHWNRYGDHWFWVRGHWRSRDDDRRFRDNRERREREGRPAPVRAGPGRPYEPVRTTRRAPAGSGNANTRGGTATQQTSTRTTTEHPSGSPAHGTPTHTQSTPTHTQSTPTHTQSTPTHTESTTKTKPEHEGH